MLPLLFPVSASAAKCENENTLLGMQPWYANLCKENTNDVEIKDIPGDIIIIIMNVLSIFLVIISYAAVAFVIWGGIQYVISNGDQAKVSSAKNTIQRALIGLLISLAAVAIVNTVSSSIGAGV